MINLDEKAMNDLWERHLEAEFDEKSGEEAIATMGPRPYVNMVPLMIGAVGRKQLQEFYDKDFLTQIPADMDSTQVSRTIGQGRIVDEFVSHFTHSIQMDWLLPGIPPTGKRLDIPSVIIVHVEDGKIVSEHIYWDQASVLVQLGLIDRSLPVRGAEIARQLLQSSQSTSAEQPEGTYMSNLDEKAMNDLLDRHLTAEFAERSSERALETMGPHPHVNLVPLMTGGVGREQVQEFYAKQLLAQIPPDMKTTPISRTIGKERIVDEYVSHFTHSIQMDWLLPGIPPTGKYLEIPCVVIAHVQDGKIVSEHIYWDQASVLVQLGLIDRSTLPVRGAEIARQVVEPTQPMNELLHRARQR